MKAFLTVCCVGILGFGGPTWAVGKKKIFGRSAYAIQILQLAQDLQVRVRDAELSFQAGTEIDVFALIHNVTRERKGEVQNAMDQRLDNAVMREIAKAFVAGLESPNPNVRSLSAEGLRVNGDASYIPQLKAALKFEDNAESAAFERTLASLRTAARTCAGFL